jgi:hypothetical protein
MTRGAAPTEIAPSLVIEAVSVVDSTAAESGVAEWPTNDGLSLYGYRAGGYRWLHVPGLAAYRFSTEGPVIASPEGGSRVRIHAVWLSSVLPLVVQARGTQVLHASAVASPRGIVALCGDSSSGKSTLAAALMQRGHEIAADDALPFAVDGDRAFGFPLPFAVRLRPASAALLGIEHVGAERPRSAPARLRALVLVRPTESSVAPVLSAIPRPSGATVGQLLPHLYCFSLEEGKEQLMRAAFALVKTVPTLRLAYPQRPESVAAASDALEDLLRE